MPPKLICSPRVFSIIQLNSIKFRIFFCYDGNLNSILFAICLLFVPVDQDLGVPDPERIGHKVLFANLLLIVAYFHFFLF